LDARETAAALLLLSIKHQELTAYSEKITCQIASSEQVEDPHDQIPWSPKTLWLLKACTEAMTMTLPGSINQ
jgi:hypothetical protein